jgi:hypothetical protein
VLFILPCAGRLLHLHQILCLPVVSHSQIGCERRAACSQQPSPSFYSYFYVVSVVGDVCGRSGCRATIGVQELARAECSLARWRWLFWFSTHCACARCIVTGDDGIWCVRVGNLVRLVHHLNSVGRGGRGVYLIEMFLLPE